MWGNMAVAMAISSPKISWRVLARSRMWVSMSCEVSLVPASEIWPIGRSIDSLRERAVALAKLVEM